MTDHALQKALGGMAKVLDGVRDWERLDLEFKVLGGSEFIG